MSGTRRELMDKVLSLLPPRMNKWFLSRFPDPGTWLAARLAFTRTNAAWAMVGHVLGLGDRHGENIMINTLTGEGPAMAQELQLMQQCCAVTGADYGCY